MNPFDFLKSQMGNLATMAQTEVTGEAGVQGVGTVKITLNGRFQIQALRIDEDAWKEGNAFVSDLVCAAFNDAMAKLLEKTRGQMGNLMSTMGLPGTPS